LCRRISIHHASASSAASSQATLSVAVTTSTCKFDYPRDVEKGWATSLDGSEDVPFTPLTPAHESLPRYDLPRSR
jgi:hypothetical protein